MTPVAAWFGHAARAAAPKLRLNREQLLLQKLGSSWQRRRAPAAPRKLVTEKGRGLLFVRIAVVQQINLSATGYGRR